MDDLLFPRKTNLLLSPSQRVSNGEHWVSLGYVIHGGLGPNILAMGHRWLRSLGAILHSSPPPTRTSKEKPRTSALLLSTSGLPGLEIKDDKKSAVGRGNKPSIFPDSILTTSKALAFRGQEINSIQRAQIAADVEMADNSSICHSPRCWYLHFNGGG